MSRDYYNTKEQIYDLFTTQPIMSALLEEFEIEQSNLKDVCEYLVLHDSELNDNTLNAFYNDSDMIDEIGELYGFSLGVGQTWAQLVSVKDTPATVLLNYTLYYYKFATTDNFYEKHFINFLPEYDREQIQKSDKLKLTIESIGRKLDDLEDKISRILDIYDFDKCPDDILDYLGQNLGYEKEDFTLSNVSFRELLKNIIEIYKIKGTNYSFSFFFKLLGFEINLKEFYFNRDLKNPENFPGMDDTRVEYFLSTNNPLLDTSEIEAGITAEPAEYLRETRNLDDWETEFSSLVTAGCLNPSEYLRGLESYNNDGLTFHSNPWLYFKTNLIEYELNPFINRLNLTASDNETIKKYIHFLSPTYLFTWINVNLRPWIEDINIVSDSNDDWQIEIFKTLGDPRPTPDPWPFDKKTAEDGGFEPPYLDYEDVSNWIELYDDSDTLVFNLVNNLNLGGDEIMGTTLKRDGVHIRQPGHPQHITDARHRADKRLSFDLLGLNIKNFTDPDEEAYWLDYSYRPYPALPINPSPFDGKTISDTNIITFDWEDIIGQQGYWIQVSTTQIFSDIIFEDDTLTISEYDPGTNLNNNIYYWRIKVRNDADLSEEDPLRWGPWSSIWNFKLKALPFPFDGEVLDTETQYVLPIYNWNSTNTQQLFIAARFSFLWESFAGIQMYEIQIDSSILTEPLIYQTSSNTYSIDLSNGVYTWKIRSKNTSGIWSDWSSDLTFTIDFPVII